MTIGSDSKLDKIARYIPDIRVWIVVGLFALAWRLLYMIEATPSLLNSAPFMSIAVLILGSGGMGAIVAFYYGGTKSSSSVMEKQSPARVAQQPASPSPTPPAPADPPQ